MLVSIIMPCFNSEKFIEYSIDSVLKQTYQQWELIIIDDFSTDSSCGIIEKFLVDKRISLVKLAANCGPVTARNRGIELASGDIIAFLDSDDVWLPEKLMKQIHCYEQDSSLAIVFSDYGIINEAGNVIKHRVFSPARVDYKMLLRSNYIGCLTSTYNCALLGKRYFKDEGHEDYILWLNILKEGHFAANVGDLLAYYRRYNRSLSANKVIASRWQWKIYRKIEHLSLPKSLYYFFAYMFIAIKKHYFK